ncbi:MAG: hypothetical protein BWK76_20555 [Desulfobulbaceae bacterium A2]|nr:MAG: hypothetical protein BWK76_20555 [Desulfobulbaceae bacterium A2]
MIDITRLKHWYVQILNLPTRDPATLDENSDLRLDSVDAVLLADAIERDFGVQIETVAQAREALSTIKGLATFLANNGGSQPPDEPARPAP